MKKESKAVSDQRESIGTGREREEAELEPDDDVEEEKEGEEEEEDDDDEDEVEERMAGEVRRATTGVGGASLASRIDCRAV